MKMSGAAKETFSERGRMLGRKEAGEIQRPGGPAKNMETQGPVTRVGRPPLGIVTEDPEGPEQGLERLENRLLQGTRLGGTLQCTCVTSTPAVG